MRRDKTTLYFDLDGPILDISHKYYRIYTDIFGEHNHPCLSKDRYWELKRSQKDISDIVSETAPPEFARIYREERLAVIEDMKYLECDRLQPGASEMLQELKGSFKLVLVTLRNRRDSLMGELEYFDLSKYFDRILSKGYKKDGWEVKKQLILDYCGSNQPRGMLIGDTEADITPAKKLKLVSCAVTCGIRSEELLRRLEPDYLVNDTEGIVQAIESEYP